MDTYGTSCHRKKCCSLRELFYVNQSTSNSSSDVNPSNKRLKTASSSYSLRLEHRGGGSMGNPGEERILLFRSDHPGVIAKVIFSSCPASPKNISSLKKVDEFDDESELSQMAQAKIHVLEVKKPYRGRDLGGLLFTEVLSVLRNRYDNSTNSGDDDFVSSSIRCQLLLDAEEDSRKHNKLVHFYEHLGCTVRPRAKVRFLNHNDGEIYRSVPMQIALRHASLRRRFVNISTDDTQDPQLSPEKWSSLVGISGGFLPVFFKNRYGNRICINSLDHSNAKASVLGSKVEWLIVEDEKGVVFRSTHGHHLLACPDGRVLAVADTDNNQFESVIPHDWECFECYRVPDTDYCPEYESSDYREARQNELWLFHTARGTYLSIDMESGCMTCTTYPTFWKSDAATFALQYANDTPKKRQHYKQSWARQSLDYVWKMREQYSGFNLCKMNISKALRLVKNIPCHSFKIKSENSSDNEDISIRTFMFTMAEEARLCGHPDWLQLVALIHDLGRVIKLIDVSSLMDFQEYDWTIAIVSRVVGCNPSRSTSFKEFSYLRSDSHDSRYNTNLGIYHEGCGLHGLDLTWTGQEYLYSMLKHNEVDIPYEGLSIIRYFLLNEWHTHGECQEFQSVDDEDLKSLVLDFYNLRQRVKRNLNKELSDEDCDRLWKTHYEWIAMKYGCSGVLDW